MSRVIWKKEMHMCLGLSVEVWKLEILMGTRPELSLWKSAGTEGAETFAVCRMWTGSNCKNCSFFLESCIFTFEYCAFHVLKRF